jgi:carbon monoxide dehydrogenase subunit G
MLTTTLIAVGSIAAICAAVVASRPSDFRISRSTVIDAPPGAAFDQVNDLDRWQEMSPYAKLDPAARYTFSPEHRGPGATLAWVGNSKVGAGKMTIIESVPDERVRMRLEFEKPMKATHLVEFSFEPRTDGTRVTWTMSGRSGFMCKAIGLFMNMDKMCGEQFAEGLANMKRIAETASQRNEAPVLAQTH